MNYKKNREHSGCEVEVGESYPGAGASVASVGAESPARKIVLGILN